MKGAEILGLAVAVTSGFAVSADAPKCRNAMPPSAPQIKKGFFIFSAATLQLAQRMRNVCIGSNRRLGTRDAVRASGVLPFLPISDSRFGSEVYDLHRASQILEVRWDVIGSTMAQ